jgi:hypothetical protein
MVFGSPCSGSPVAVMVNVDHWLGKSDSNLSQPSDSMTRRCEDTMVRRSATGHGPSTPRRVSFASRKPFGVIRRA